MTLLSGGCHGADLIFEKYAKLNQHQLEIYKNDFLSKEKVISGRTISQRDSSNKNDSFFSNFGNYHDICDRYDNYLIDINNKYLNRKYPTAKDYTNSLLRRDVYVGLNADIVYAITWLDNNNGNIKIHGGTAWACYAYIDKCIQAKVSITNCFIYDQNVCKWFVVNIDYNSSKINFVECNQVPPINKDTSKYAGIGTREINDNGINAIKKLYSANKD